MPAWFFIFHFSFFYTQAEASHLVGGELSYTKVVGQNKVYRVRLVLYRDCAGIAMSNTQTVLVRNGTTGVAQTEGQLLENEGFETVVFPNPAKHEFTITIHSESSSKIHAALYDLMGRRILEINDMKVNEPYVVNQPLPNGIYFILIHHNDHHQSVRLIKED